MATPNPSELHATDSPVGQIASIDSLPTKSFVTQIRRRLLPARASDGEAGYGHTDPLLMGTEVNGNQPDALPDARQMFLLQRYKQVTRTLGLFAVAVLVVGTITILAALGFLSFLWFSDAGNGNWQRIATTNWMTRAVSLTALAIRNAASLQAVVATSMLAGLAIEKRAVLSRDLASISVMRNANGGPYVLAWLIWKTFLRMRAPWRQALLPLTLILLVVTTILVQFTSTVLLADLSLNPTLGLAKSVTLSTHFRWDTTDPQQVLPLHQVTRGSSWLRVPPFYPTFAEFHETPASTSPDVLDTGRLLRAFLPLQAQQQRYDIGEYEGMATVLDSRVVCVRPKLGEPALHLDGIESVGDEGNYRFGLVTYVETPSPVPGILNVESSSSTGSMASGCLIDPIQGVDDVWRITLCQINQNAALPSEFEGAADFKPDEISGAAYLVLNVSSGTLEDWSTVTNIQFKGGGAIIGPDFSSAVPPVQEATNGVWQDLLFDNGGVTRLSVSLCYAALDSADLYVHASSSGNRTEPVPSFDESGSRYRYDDVLQQLARTKDSYWTYGSPEQRGLLKLQPRINWHPGSDPGDYVRPTSESSFLLTGALMEGSSPVQGPDENTFPLEANWTAYLDYEQGGVVRDPGPPSGSYMLSDIYPDPSFSSLLQDILRSGGDIVHGISSLVTVLSASTYYDKLGQFNGRSDTKQAMFVSVLVPQRHGGYTAVVVVVVLHLTLVALILSLFLVRTTVSTIGNAWQTVAQVKDLITERLLDANTLATDTEVQAWMTVPAHPDTDGLELHAIGKTSNTRTSNDSISPLRPDAAIRIRLAETRTRTELVVQ